MGTAENQNPFRPYYNERDCSLGICTRYCSQFCYIYFPPPPKDEPSSPLIVAAIIILSGAFLLVSYCLIVSKYCKNNNNSPSSFQQEQEMPTTANGQPQAAATSSPPSGLDETLIKSISVRKYRRGDGLFEGTDCAVCLNEFEENEPLRLLPKCSHGFHQPCIDAWLASHSNCPLCRGGVVVALPRVQSTEEEACVVVEA